jgi:hypothetical protein
MLIPAQAALLRHAQDIAPGQAAGRAEARLEAGRAAGAGAAERPRREAVLPPVAEGQYEPQPSNMTFAEFLSGLNPLQHLPIVGMVYRAITGDVPPTVMRVAGGFLLGGAVGGIISAVGAAAEEMYTRSRAGPDAPTPADQGTAVAAAAAPNAAPAVPAAASATASAVAAPGALRPVSVADDAGERLNRLRAAGDLYTRHMTPLPMPPAWHGVRLADARPDGG